MKKHIVCLGDSNTHGYCADPLDCADPALARFNEEERWTKLLQAALGDEFLVLEEGLSGRTTVFQDPLYEGLDALHYLWPCLKSHEPLSLLIIMLGTNDVKQRLGGNAHAIALGMRRLIQKAQRGSPIFWSSPPCPLISGWSRALWRTKWAWGLWRSPGSCPPIWSGWRRKTGSTF